jgi:hypothetical protein
LRKSKLVLAAIIGGVVLMSGVLLAQDDWERLPSSGDSSNPESAHKSN